MTTIAILYEGVDITADVDFSDQGRPRFVSRASGDPGDAQLRILDKHHDVYVPGYFHPGGTVELFVDGTRVWDGWALVVKRGYAFDVDDTSQPTATPRYWSLQCYDRNLLFTKRFLYRVAQPADDSGFADWPAGTPDKTVIDFYLANYVDLTGDLLDVTSGIQSIDSPGLFEDFVLGGVGLPWRTMFDDLVGATGAVYWIGPDRVVHYADDTTPTAPFKIVDRAPLAGEVSCRELDWGADATALANDAMVWGAGRGSEFPTFARYESAASIAEHGRWQWSDTFVGMYREASVQRRAETYVEGSPQHHRGHKDDQDMVNCTIFEPGLTVGMVVDMRSVTYQRQDTLPVRTMTMTFPTQHDVRYDLLLSHTIDVPFAAVDTWVTRFTIPVNETIPLPPLGNPNSLIIDTQEGDVTDYGHPINAPGIWFNSDINGIHGDEDSNIPAGTGPQDSIYFNVPYTDPQIHCFYLATGSPIGPGGYVGHFHSEFWYPITSGFGWFNDQPAPTPVDVLVRVNTGDGQGVAQLAEMGISNAQHPTGPSDMGIWQHYGAVTPNTDALIAIPASRFAIRSRQIDVDLVQHVWHLWLVFAPAWSIDTGLPYVCDIDYYYPGTGPKPPSFTGQGGSGQLVMPDHLQFWWQPNTITTSTDEIVTSFRQNQAGFGEVCGIFYTGWAYVPGTLEVNYEGTSLRAGLDFTEVDPANGIFRIAQCDDLENVLHVSYERFGGAQRIERRFNGQTGGWDPMDPGNGDTYFPPVPGKTGGKVYRPRPLSQFGWGTRYDGTNCWATGSAMLLDRHTLGQLRYPDHGSPLNTPPSHRLYSGNTDPVNGGDHDDAARAWLNGWGQVSLNVGFVPWSYFISHLNSGRGASVAGLYGTLPDQFRHSDTFTGAHEIYCNEQFGDGSFWVVDPIYPRPTLWPYEVMRTYAQSLSSHGNVYVNFSRVTGLI